MVQHHVFERVGAHAGSGDHACSDKSRSLPDCVQKSETLAGRAYPEGPARHVGKFLAVKIGVTLLVGIEMSF